MSGLIKKLIIFEVVFLLCSVVTLAQAYKQHDEYHSEHHYGRLLDRAQFIYLSHPDVKLIQQNLAMIYQNDLNWQRDVALRKHPLTDGVIGPVTLFWLQRFAFDFKIEPIGNYAEELRVRLEQIAAFADMFPNETAVLLSADFADWNDQQFALQRDHDYDIRRSGSQQALLELICRFPQSDCALSERHSKQGTAYHDAIEPLYYYQLTPEDFNLLQGKEHILQQLLKLENQSFDNLALLNDAVSRTLEAYPNLLKKISTAVRNYFSNGRPLVITQPFIQYLEKVLAGESWMRDLSPVITGLLEQTMVDMIYPTQELFDKAAQAKIHAGIGACVSTQAHNQYITGLRIDDEAFLELETDLLNNPYYHGMPLIRTYLEWVKLLRARQESCIPENAEIVDAFVRTLYKHVVQPAIAVLYKKKAIFDHANTIRWDGNGCGCVLDYLAGTVYGLYPFWQANGEKQIVNFSVLSRVAYYGLSFDRSGSIIHANDAGNTFDLSRFLAENPFVAKARKHNSKVDWVIHKDQSYWDQVWRRLDSGQKKNVLKKLRDEIVQLLTRPLNPGRTKLTFGVIPVATQGDGVTLDFRGYPNKDSGLFNDFFSDLRQDLDEKGGDYFVNIMVPQSALGEGIYTYANLLELISGVKITDAHSSFEQMDIYSELKSKILVLLEEPTTQAKKTLRQDVENGGLYGVLRGLVLRNIIPIIEFDNQNWVQLEDDLVYFKDNFGGVGFWPMPINEPGASEQMSGRCEDVQMVEVCLVGHFQDVYRNGQPDSWLDRFVCENRDIFWGLLTALTLLFLILLAQYFHTCQSKQKALYIRAIFATTIPALVIALLLLLFDPMLEELAEGNIPLIVVVTAVVIGSIIFYRNQLSIAKKPSRPKHRMTTVNSGMSPE